jgi:type IV secretory pathway VirD2 relaxase
MTKHDNERFRPRPAPPRTGSRGRSQRFLSRVLTELSRAGDRPGTILAGTRGRVGAKLGRGHVAAGFAGASLGPRSRRVAIKARLVVLKTAGSRSVKTHLHYIARDAVSRDAQSTQPYNARTDSPDLQEFEAAGSEDRHQFRFIVAPEDALRLDDLRGFTRHLMNRMEADLGTRLDWVAVDHWDTDNPHTHVVLRGKDDDGRDLVIARSYISHGMRLRASELATSWLGPRTESELHAGLQREVEGQRWTGLDQDLQARARDGVIDLVAVPTDAHARYRRSLLIGRLQRLETMGIAAEQATRTWRLRPDAEETLRALGERGDIVRALQRAFTTRQRELAIFDATTATATVVGRVAAKGLADELNDRAYVIIDGVDGRGHYVALPAGADLGEIPIGSIAEARAVTARAADHRIAALTENGLYRTARHLAQLPGQHAAGGNAEEIVAAHVRRLEALRRAGFVERIDDGVWRVPNDLVARGRSYDRQRLGAAAVQLRCHLPVEKQIRAIGATWLDHQLVGDVGSLSNRGFATTVRAALAAREEFLVEQGFAERRGQRVILARDLLAKLRDRDIEATANTIATETGLTYRPLSDATSASGVYRRSVLLASGRFAMLDDGLGFSLVPWRPVIERRLGQTVSAVVRGEHVTWGLGRGRAPSIA